MNGLGKSVLALGLLFTTASFTNAHNLCKGFLPPNNFKIPVSLVQAGGITEKEFNEILDVVEKYYTPVVAAHGGQFMVNRLWEDDTVNASADQSGGVWNLNMYGGLARFPTINKDGYMLVACHEVGHHLGGAPKYYGMDWATNEGQADYYANLDCLRFMFTDADNAEFVKNNTVDTTLAQNCGTTFTTQEEKNLCMRAGMAGMNVGMVFHDLSNEKDLPSFATPDPSQVEYTSDEHPATQCRVDTYYQGSLCVHDLSVQPSDTDPTVGTCTAQSGHTIGLRPRCWYAPDALATPVRN